MNKTNTDSHILVTGASHRRVGARWFALAAAFTFAAIGAVGVANAQLAGGSEVYASRTVSQPMSSSLGNLALGCFIDTPAFDRFTTPTCRAVSFRSNGIAVFDVLNRGGGSFSFSWSDPRCSGPACALPIGIGSINLSVVVTDNATGASVSLSATATVDFEPGPPPGSGLPPF